MEVGWVGEFSTESELELDFGGKEGWVDDKRTRIVVIIGVV